MASSAFNILFLGATNSARSIMAEGILRMEGRGRFRVFSAGRFPASVVNPFALATLAAHNYPAYGLTSKHWKDLIAAETSEMDLVYTIFDGGRLSKAPVGLGRQATAEWQIADPSTVEGSDGDKQLAFDAAFEHLCRYITDVVSLSDDSIRILAKIATTS